MKGFSIIGARGRVDDRESLVDYFRAAEGDGIALDSEEVKGIEHIQSAIMHSQRAFERGDNVSTRMLMETLLYASGERQISLAISKMGVKSGSEDVIFILEGLEPEKVLRELGMERDDSVIAIVSEDEKKDALERVALVDIIKR